VLLSAPVTCIVVNWNGWRDTVACIESLLQSDYSNLSILVVDNGSSDGSVPQLRAAFPWLEILNAGANLGFAAGNNVGIEIALKRDAIYVWLLNNDTIVDPHTLTTLVSAAASDPSLGEIGSVLRYAHEPTRVQAWGGGKINLWTGMSRHYHGPVEADKLGFLTAASVLVPAAVFRRVGLLDDGYFMYWEDADLSFRIRAAGWKLGVAPDATLRHKEGGSTGQKSAALDRYVSASGIRFLRKFAPIPIVPILILMFGRSFRRFFRGDWKRGIAVFAGLKIGTKHAHRDGRIRD
jgi:GT2 family glycosyltransferase